MINKKGTIAISQIVILIVSILAITFLIGAATPMVKAGDTPGGIVNDFPCSTQSPGSSCVASGTCSGTISPGTCPGSFGGGQECCMPSIGEGNSGGGTFLKQTLISGAVGGGTDAAKKGLRKPKPIQSPAPGDIPPSIDNVPKSAPDAPSGPLGVGTFFRGFKSVFFKTTVTEGAKMGWIVAGQVTGVLAAAAAGVAITHYGLEALGAGERNVRGATNAAIIGGSVAAAAGIIYVSTAGASLTAAAVAAGGALVLGPVGWIVLGATIAVAGAWIALAYQDYSMETFSYKPSLWKPIPKGENCEQCNDLPLGCNSYQCHSFGEACELQEVGTENEACVGINPQDIQPPEVTPLERALVSEDYEYSPVGAYLPEDDGARIIYKESQDGCIPPYTSLTLGVNTSEPATCRIDIESKRYFEDLLQIMDSENQGTEHTLELPHSAIASSSAMESLGVELLNGNEYNFFIRCKDINDNPSPTNFIMQFCVDDGPDTLSPEILSTSFISDVSCIRNDLTSVDIDVFTNEPATCRWDFRNTNYDDMPYEMDCSQTPLDYYPQNTLTYGCRGELSGIKDTEETPYFIKCNDQPWLEGKETIQASRNANLESEIVVLKGSKELIIDEITINGKENNITIKDSTKPVAVDVGVTTLGGCEEGYSRCQYATQNSIGNLIWTEFYNEGIFEYNYYNNNTFRYGEGAKNLPIRCTDVGGNTATSFANFTIEIDEEAPVLARAYYEDDYLKLITTEEAECVYSTVYSTFGCNYAFDDGSEIPPTEMSLDHFVTWDTTSDMFVKCRDSYGNQPSIGKCSIIVRAFERDDQI
jgi:hypothetical protein